MYNYNQTYDLTAQATIPIRELESKQLLKAAAKLQAARNSLAARGDVQTDSVSDDAVIYNRKLWCLFFSSLSDDANPLDREIKTSLKILIGFILECSMKALIKPTCEDIDSLIAVNITIARGLKK